MFAGLGILIYFPALRGEFLMDDLDLYIVGNQLLKDPNGLWKFWFTNEPLDYFPLTYSTFWVEWRIAGESTFLYHFNNVVIHIAASVGVYWLLKALHVPWALWIAVIFLVHPIQVESVAWISQRKTVLSVFLGVFAAWLYVASQKIGGRSRSIWAIVFYALSLSAKPTLITLPVAFALVELVKCQSSLRALVSKLWPYFLLSLVFGIIGVFYQQKLMGEVEVRGQNLIERILSMSWAFLFYFRQLFAVWTLNFVYPRWDISAYSMIDWLPTLIVFTVTGLLWAQRRRLGDEPFLAWSVAWITLFPILGLVDVFYWRYSYVGDHYVYQSIPAMVAVFSYLLSNQISRLRIRETRLLAFASLAILAWGSFSRSEVYKTQEAIWTDSIAKNPRAGLALNNLGVLMRSPELLLKCVEVQPQIHEAWMNLAKIYLAQGNLLQAAICYENGALRSPQLARMHLECLIGQAICNAGMDRQELSREIVESIQERSLNGELVDPIPAHCALQLDVLRFCLDRSRTAISSGSGSGGEIPFEKFIAENSDRLSEIARDCEDCGRIDYAIRACQVQLAQDPDNLDVLAAIGRCYFKLQRFELALQYLESAIKAGHDSLETELNLGSVLMSLGRIQEGLTAFERASRKPESSAYFRLWSSLGLAYVVNAQPRKAFEAWGNALRINPDDPATLRDVAWLIATNEELGAQKELADFAIQCDTRCCHATEYKQLNCLDALAAAWANDGDFGKAVETMSQTISLAENGKAPQEH